MEIIKKGKTQYKEYLFTCRVCGCEARFDEREIRSDRDGEYVVCPQCGRFVSVLSDYVRELGSDD